MSVDWRVIFRTTWLHLRGTPPAVLPPQKTLWGWARCALAFQPAHLQSPEETVPGTKSLNRLSRVHARIAAQSEGSVSALRYLAPEITPTGGLSESFIEAFRDGTELLASARYQEAISQFSLALRIKPDHAESLASRAAAHRLLGHNNLAINDATRAITLQPDLAWAYATRGAIHRLQKEYREARADLNKAIDLQPDYEWCIAGRGELNRLTGHRQQALADLNRALELNPRNDWALMCRGAVYLDAQEEQLALRAFREAVSVNPDGDWALGLAALTYRLMGKDLTRDTADPRAMAPPELPTQEVRISRVAEGFFRVVDYGSSTSKIVASWEEAYETVRRIFTGHPLAAESATIHDPTGHHGTERPEIPVQEVQVKQGSPNSFELTDLETLRPKTELSLEEIKTLGAEIFTGA
ncbi:tetratricopeptide repeat protein [Streptomyces sp. NPDC013161]|uniref:tetratricopeptide repeat protein n=1 Tax=Streptomyces sp. NPDC013161 TaxID=3364862 RepID=UPI0036C56FE2